MKKDDGIGERSNRLIAIDSRLCALYGHPRWHSHGSPLDVLIATVLSQHTSDSNTARAFSNLRALFPTWPAVTDAPTSEIADAIRSGGLANIKAPRIQSILRSILSETGELSLEFLRCRALDDARSWLKALPGVGPKTAGCVLLFSLGLPAMPVDTHVYRVARRLGFIPANVNANEAHDLLDRLIGPDRDVIYSLHLNLIRHGRSVCKARTPACHVCVLADICPSATNLLSQERRSTVS